jgi:hypothetical protein
MFKSFFNRLKNVLKDVFSKGGAMPSTGDDAVDRIHKAASARSINMGKPIWYREAHRTNSQRKRRKAYRKAIAAGIA